MSFGVLPESQLSRIELPVGTPLPNAVPSRSTMPPPGMPLPDCSTVPRTSLRAMTVFRAPTSPIPTPPYAGAPPDALRTGHIRLFAVTWLSWIDASPLGATSGDGAEATTIPEQLPYALLSAIRPPSESTKKIPLPTLSFAMLPVMTAFEDGDSVT